MIGDAKLASETKTAIHEEEERKECLKKCKNVVTDEGLILEQDENTKEVILEVRKSLIPALKPHQCAFIDALLNQASEEF